MHGIGIQPDILFGELIDTLVGASIGDLYDATPNRRGGDRIARIDDGDRNARVAPQVARLHPFLGGVKEDSIAIYVDPDYGYLW